MNNTCSIVIPFFNEGENAGPVIQNLLDEIRKSGLSFELVLVDNGSYDNTPNILESYRLNYPALVKTIRVPVNEGYGWGIITGLKLASGDYIGYMCGDGQIKPQDVISVADLLFNNSCDLAKVTRIQRHDGIIRKILSIGYNMIFRVLFKVKTRDVNGSPKILKSDALRRMNLISKDWFLDAEILIKSFQQGLTVKEIPVEFLPRIEGKSHVSFNTIFEFLINIISYKLYRGK